jgi:hypothetical protein
VQRRNQQGGKLNEPGHSESKRQQAKGKGQMGGTLFSLFGILDLRFEIESSSFLFPLLPFALCPLPFDLLNPFRLP